MEHNLEKFLLIDIPENICFHFANARKLEDSSWEVYYDYPSSPPTSHVSNVSQ